MDAGIRPEVYAAAKVNPIGGAFWLYMLPPSVRDYVAGPDPIIITPVGDRTNYARSMWGSAYPTSFPAAPEVKYGYAPVPGLAALWGDVTYTVAVIETERMLRDLALGYDIVFCTIPTPRSLADARQSAFRKRLYIVTYRRPEGSAGGNRVRYIGDGGPVLRVSDLWDWKAIETATEPRTIRRETVRKGWKLHPETPGWSDVPARNIVLTGRFARWDRRELSHDSYVRTQTVLANWIAFGQISASSTAPSGASPVSSGTG
jgi:hypothetical protein